MPTCRNKKQLVHQRRLTDTLSATLRRSSPQYPIVRIYRKATEEFRDFALIPRASRSFSPWVRRRVLPPLHYSPLPLFESTAKTIGGAIKAVAASPLIAAQTVPFGSRFGGWILRGRPGVTLPALRVAIRLPGARSGQRVRQLPELLEASVRGHPAMRRCNLSTHASPTCRQLYSIR